MNKEFPPNSESIARGSGAECRVLTHSVKHDPTASRTTLPTSMDMLEPITFAWTSKGGMIWNGFLLTECSGYEVDINMKVIQVTLIASCHRLAYTHRPCSKWYMSFTCHMISFSTSVGFTSFFKYKIINKKQSMNYILNLSNLIEKGLIQEFQI